MKEYFLSEYYKANDTSKKTAGGKAREDISYILKNLSIIELQINYTSNNNKLLKNVVNTTRLIKALASVSRGDILYIQFPLVQMSRMLIAALSVVQLMGVSLVLVVHDLESLRRNVHSNTIQAIDSHMLKISSACIVHNTHMINKLVDMGIDSHKLIPLGIFDYIIDDDYLEISDDCHDDTVIVAGNLAKVKSGYIYDLPSCIDFNLYGINYQDTGNCRIHYKGSFDSCDLPRQMKGNYGLVWDGPSINTCEGEYGEYLRINNPHKTSLYLACGIPVIIWNEAALADFILNNKCGIALDSLECLDEKLDSTLIDQRNLNLISKRIRSGYYTNNAVNKVRSLLI